MKCVLNFVNFRNQRSYHREIAIPVGFQEIIDSVQSSVRFREGDLRYYLDGDLEIFGDFLFDEKFNGKEIRILIKEDGSNSDSARMSDYNRVYLGKGDKSGRFQRVFGFSIDQTEQLYRIEQHLLVLDHILREDQSETCHFQTGQWVDYMNEYGHWVQGVIHSMENDQIQLNILELYQDQIITVSGQNQLRYFRAQTRPSLAQKSMCQQPEHFRPERHSLLAGSIILDSILQHLEEILEKFHRLQNHLQQTSQELDQLKSKILSQRDKIQL